MIKYIRKFNDLEIPTFLINIKGEIGFRKLYRGMISSDKINESDIDHNFLCINLKKSNLICLDIEGHPNSVESFYEFLSAHDIDSDSLLMEKTMNNGLHVYFKNNYDMWKESTFNEYNNIHFDLLTKRAFTAPSTFNGKTYEWITDFWSLKSRNIPDTPAWLFSLLEPDKKYFIPKRLSPFL